jgi:hypothetical protein
MGFQVTSTTVDGVDGTRSCFIDWYFRVMSLLKGKVEIKCWLTNFRVSQLRTLKET